jgi:hypothetical protein
MPLACKNLLRHELEKLNLGTDASLKGSVIQSKLIHQGEAAEYEQSKIQLEQVTQASKAHYQARLDFRNKNKIEIKRCEALLSKSFDLRSKSDENNGELAQELKLKGDLASIKAVEPIITDPNQKAKAVEIENRLQQKLQALQGPEIQEYEQTLAAIQKSEICVEYDKLEKEGNEELAQLGKLANHLSDLEKSFDNEHRLKVKQTTISSQVDASMRDQEALLKLELETRQAKMNSEEAKSNQVFSNTEPGEDPSRKQLYQEIKTQNRRYFQAQKKPLETSAKEVAELKSFREKNEYLTYFSTNDGLAEIYVQNKTDLTRLHINSSCKITLLEKIEFEFGNTMPVTGDDCKDQEADLCKEYQPFFE